MSTHPTAGGDGGTNHRKRSAPLWSDLPDDLLGKVLSRIVSPRDRVRFTAVCGPWRSAASRQPPRPAAPLLLLSSRGRNRMEHLCGPDDSWVLPGAPSMTKGNKRFVGSHDGGWVALLDMDSYKLSVLNLCSGAEVALSEEQSNILFRKPDVSKIIFSGDPASSDGCILAAIIEGQLYITLSRVGCRDARWTTCPWYKDLIDIAFCNGELYGLTRTIEKLYKFEIEMKGDCTLSVTTGQHLSIQRLNELPLNYGAKGHMCYIFELDGKISMAVRARWLPGLFAHFFKVFHLVDDDDTGDETYKHKWEEVTSFGDYALFIGPTGSKAVHVPVMSSAEYHGVEGNHIYYIKHTFSWISKLPEDVVHSVTSDDGDDIKMYRLKDQSYGDGVERTGYYVQGCNSATWVHLPNL